MLKRQIETGESPRKFYVSHLEYTAQWQKQQRDPACLSKVVDEKQLLKMVL